jgi:hypothetical protein
MLNLKLIVLIFVCSLVEQRGMLKPFRLFDNKFISDFMYKKNVYNNITFLKFNSKNTSNKLNNSIIKASHARNPNKTITNIQSNKT